MIVASRTTSERCETGLGIIWEEVSCLLCGSDRAETVLEAGDQASPGRELRFAVVECRDCGLWYTNPRPSVESIGQFYADDYSPHRRPRLATCKVGLFTGLMSRLIGRPCIERHRMPWHGQGRLLDFGCGGGQFLVRMQDQGWKVAGLDTSEKVTARLRDDFGLKAYAGSLPHPDLAPGSFDVITMWASLAHVHQPLAVLQAAFELLAPGGRLYAQVPNRHSWDQRLFGRHSFTLDLPRHLTHFAPATMRMMLAAAGFEVRFVRQIAQPEWLRKSGRIARRAGAAGVGSRLLSIKPINLLFSWLAYCCGGGDNIYTLAVRPS